MRVQTAPEKTKELRQRQRRVRVVWSVAAGVRLAPPAVRVAFRGTHSRGCPAEGLAVPAGPVARGGGPVRVAWPRAA